VKHTLINTLISILLLTIAGCDNELEVYAPYKETPVIYCVLDGGVDTQYVRVAKTYQIEGESFAGARDSMLGYFNEELNVRISSEQTGLTTTLKPVRLQKDAGIFNIRNDAYKTTEPFALTPGQFYTVQVYIPSTDKTYAARVQAIDAPSEIIFSRNSKLDAGNNNLAITAGRYGRMFSCYVRFYYALCDSPSQASCPERFIDYFAARNILADENKSFESIYITMRGSDWVNYLRRELSAMPGKSFRYLRTDVNWVSGGSEFELAYYQSLPSLFFVSKSTNTSNIPGALGFVGAMYTSSLQNITVDPSLIKSIQTIPGMQK
jgi:hypothetical protein